MVYILLILLVIISVLALFSKEEVIRESALVMSILIILGTIICYSIKSYLDKVFILYQVGYKEISDEEKANLSPNELKEFIEINGVYFKKAE